jgi:hypothetical protein
MVIPYRYNFEQAEHTATPIKLGVLIPEVLGALNKNAQEQNQVENPDVVVQSITIITESNRSKIEKLAKTKSLMVVHCWYQADEDARITLSPTTYLWDEVLDIRTQLKYVDGIVVEPELKWIQNKETAKFTLYFEPLPPICKSFRFWEQTYESFQFAAFNIYRNAQDEYWFKLHSCPF